MQKSSLPWEKIILFLTSHGWGANADTLLLKSLFLSESTLVKVKVCKSETLYIVFLFKLPKL